MYPCARSILIINVNCNTLCGGQTVRATKPVGALQSALSRAPDLPAISDFLQADE